MNNSKEKVYNTEILAPAGNFESLVAGVRCGANAVYLGGRHFSARQGADNFSKSELEKAVNYAHARGVKVHLAVNTIVFDDELKKAELAIKEAAQAGVDALIIQDMAVAEIARNCAPDIEMHASTQMAVHNLDGVLELASLGFSRAVLARELTISEIEHIAKSSPIEIECFVHGALCMSVSGQCYISSMIGGRSGNRGRCAQTCRLPFVSCGHTHALSLKDLSVIEAIPALSKLGVSSFKIEGRLKRPEYVAAAVTACKDVLNGINPDYEILQNVFSRSGFTQGYLEDDRGSEMFGTRRREDVVSMSGSLKELAGLYFQEQPLVEVDFHFTMKKDSPVVLKATAKGTSIVIEGENPQIALKVATDGERAKASLEKTGNTPFYPGKFEFDIEDGLMLPMSQLNALRREALDALISELEKPSPKKFIPYKWEKAAGKKPVSNQKLRVRLETKEQLSDYIINNADEVVLSLTEAVNLDSEVLSKAREKLILELPRIAFELSTQERIKSELEKAMEMGLNRAIASEIGGIHMAKMAGFTVSGDFPLNIVNNISVSKYAKIGLKDVTMSIEYAFTPEEPESEIPKGIVAYGKAPLMIFRNHPVGIKQDQGSLIDRKSVEFPVKRKGDISVLYNAVPIFWADQLKNLEYFDFLTLYFTDEDVYECKDIVRMYKKGGKISDDYTRGLYLRKID